MHAHRSSSDHPPAVAEPMRAEDAQRMLAGRDQPERRPRRSVRRTLVIAIVLFTIYALSIGPLYWQWYGAKVGVGSPIFILLYRPLEKLAEWVPAVGHFLNWYVSQWIY